MFFKASLIHGYICQTLLFCAIVPLVKDKNGKLDNSNNYRGIGLSCLILKIFDWLILILYENELTTDSNQFGFQEESSCAMLSWTVIEIVNSFSRAGSPVFACLLDYRKAFDFVNHKRMFSNLLRRNVSPIFLRLMMIIYIHQKCYVKWNQTRSYSFSVTNGTRQGAVFSPKGGFSTYLDDLMTNLRRSGQGCFQGLHWYGALAWADDLILLSPSVQGLQSMVDMCQAHAEEADLVFSTDTDPTKSKTVCIAFNCLNKENLTDIILNGDKLPWKESVKHVGTILQSNGTMECDLRQKRAVYIQACMNLNQEFECLSGENQLRLLRLYNSHYTGSQCWDFTSKMFDQLMNSYNVNIRIIFNLPRKTHCWMMEEISGGKHPKQMIYSRFLKFIKTLEENKRESVKALFNTMKTDVRSLTGTNIRKIFLDTGIQYEPITPTSHLLRNYRVYKMPKEDEWKLSLLVSLMEIRDDHWEVLFNDETDNSLEENDIESMIDEVCCN